MSWRDKLVEASFKGVPFKLDSGSRTAGRKVELDDFSDSSSPYYYSDQGLENEVYNIEGYIIQNLANGFDYFEERDNLIKAINSKGTGILVHPLYGEIKCGVYGECQIEESLTNDTGIARFSMRFVKVDDKVQEKKVPTPSKDAKGLIDSAVEQADKDVSDNFASKFKAARAYAENIGTTIKTGLKKINSAVLGIKGGISSAVATASGAIVNTLTLVDNVLDAPCDIFNTIKGSADQMSAICGMAGEIISGGVTGACSGESRGTVTTLNGETVPRELGTSCINAGLAIVNDYDETELGFIPATQINNIIATIDLFKYSLLAELMRIAIRTEFLSTQETLMFAKMIQDALDAFLLRLGSEVDQSEYDYISGDDIDNGLMFNACESLRDVFIDNIYRKVAETTKEIDYKIGAAVMPCIVLAYDKYEDINRADEIYNINYLTIKHPGFLPQGETIKILNE